MTAFDLLDHPDDDAARGAASRAEAAALPIERACRLVIDGRRAARALADWVRRFALSEPEFQVLWCLRDVNSDGLDQTTLAHRLALSPAQVSATVERLSAQGWIAKHSRPEDRRRHLWQLSTQGCSMLQTTIHQAASLFTEPSGSEPHVAANADGRKAAA